MADYAFANLQTAKNSHYGRQYTFKQTMKGRCPVCVKHIASHSGVLIAYIYKPALLKYAP